MIKCIRCQIPNEFGNYLDKLFLNLNIGRLYWYNVKEFNQIFKTPKFDFLLEREVYDGGVFKHIISTNEYYTISVKLQAHLTQKHLGEIKSYDDFVNSDCVVILSIIDNIFVTLYTKDDNIFKIVKHNVQENNFLHVKIITNVENIIF